MNNGNTTTRELPTACAGFRHTCEAENASKFAEWITTRGGLAVWLSADLGDPSKSWTSPKRNAEGQDYQKPSWQAQNEPVIITDPAEVGVVESKEVKRFRVGCEEGGNGLVCTAASSRRIRKELEKAGEGAYHLFDYGAGQAVIVAPTGKWRSLAEWIAEHGGSK